MAETETVQLMEPPIIDIDCFLNKRDEAVWREECRKVAQSFHQFGILIVRDPRVNHQHNATFIDMVESYFEKVSL